MVGSTMLRFQGHVALRQRIVLSCITGKPVRIDKIRSDDEQAPGLSDYEVSFLRLVERVCNGCAVEISYTGTSVLFRPGTITGGRVEHECALSRAIGYYLEPLLVLALFAKRPLQAVLRGVTNDNVDVSVDTIRTVTLPLIRKFGVEGDIEMKIARRGAVPLGGGEVYISVPVVKQLRPIVLTDGGSIKRIRGIAYATRVAPQMATRVGEASRELLAKFTPDVHIYTDVYKGVESGRSPGYALTLVAETDSGVLLSAECAYQPRKLAIEQQKKQQEEETEKQRNEKQKQEETETNEMVQPQDFLEEDYHFPTPEDLGVRTARLLLREIRGGGCVDTVSQWVVLLLMALGPEDVSKVRIGRLTAFSVTLLRDIRQFTGTTFKIAQEEDTAGMMTAVLTCLGTGLVNVNRRVQ